MVRSINIGPKEFMIPHEWGIKSFGELVNIIKGHSYKSKYYSNKEDENAMIFISLKSINKHGGFNKEGIKYYKEDIKEKKKVKSGEVIIGNTDLNRDAEVVGYPIFVPDFNQNKEICISMDVSVLRLKNENELLERYFYYLLSTKKVHNAVKAFAEGSTVLHLDLDSFSKIKLPIPPLSEQKKIASILSSVDKSIEKTDEVIEETKELKKGLMQELLTKGIGHSEFKKIVIGPKNIYIPKEWKIDNINNIAKVKGRIGWRGYKKSDLREEGPYVLGAKHINDNNRLNLDDPVYISREKYEESPEIKVKNGDIILVQRGSLGKVVIIDREIGEATINPSMVLLKNIGIDNSYLYYYLCSKTLQNLIEIDASTTAVPMISQKQIKNYIVPIPLQKEQKKIASILSSVDAKIQKEEEYKSKLERLKKGLMQKLLTGEIRVNTEMEV